MDSSLRSLCVTNLGKFQKFAVTPAAKMFQILSGINFLWKNFVDEKLSNKIEFIIFVKLFFVQVAIRKFYSE